MLVELNFKKARFIAIVSGIIYIIATTPYAISKAGYHWFDFPFKETIFDSWIFNVGQAWGNLLVYWALKVCLFSHKPTRYAIDFYLDFCVVDCIHQTFFQQQTHYWTQTNYLLCAGVLLYAKIWMNKNWHWFRIQKII